MCTHVRTGVRLATRLILRTSTHKLYMEKVLYISQTSENSFGTPPQNWTRSHSNVIFFNLFAYKSSIM